MRPMVLLFLLAACEPKSTELGDDTAGGGDTDTVDPTVAPVVETVTTQCSPSVDDIDIWSVTAAVSDPQGSGTLEAVGTVLEIYSGDTTLDTITMACGDDACTGSWRGTDNNVYCDTEAMFRIIAMDQDGNTSLPYEYDPVE
jgi:hypothetical protein